LGFTVTVASAVSNVDATATPGTVQAAASIPSPSVQADFGSTATPATVQAAASIPAPSVSVPGADPAAYRSHTTASSGSGSYTIGRPSGLAEGDVLGLAAWTDTADATSIVGPSGWTLVLSENSAEEYTRGRVWVTTAGLSEPSTYT